MLCRDERAHFRASIGLEITDRSMVLQGLKLDCAKSIHSLTQTKISRQEMMYDYRFCSCGLEGGERGLRVVTEKVRNIRWVIVSVET